MLRIEDGAIYLTRGDTAYLDLYFTVDDEVYEPAEGDTLVLSVKKKITDQEYAVRKEVPASTGFKLVPEDTKDLDYGKYFYDIELRTAEGDVFTVIEKSAFNLREEVGL